MSDLWPGSLTRPGRVLSGAVAAVIAVPLLLGVVQARGTPASRPQMSGGGAWLASPAQGLVTLIDGPSDQVVGAVRVQQSRSASTGTTAVQAGSSAFVVDSDTGTVVRVDGATYETSPAVPFGVAGGELSVLPGAGTAYVVDGARRVVSVIDPKTLDVRRSLALAARPGPARPRWTATAGCGW